MKRRARTVIGWPLTLPRWGRLGLFLAWVAACGAYFEYTSASLANDKILLGFILVCVALSVVFQVWMTHAWNAVGLGLFGLLCGFGLFFFSFAPRVYGVGRAPEWIGHAYRGFFLASAPVLALGLGVMAWREWQARRRRRDGGP